MVCTVNMELRGLGGLRGTKGGKGDEADKQGWTGKLFFHRAGRGQKSMGRGRAGPPSPPAHNAGRGGSGAGNILRVSAD